MPPQRIVVIGVSCAGKTSFASELARARDLDHVNLDSLHWLEGWTAQDPEVFVAQVDTATRGAGWIVEGGYPRVQDLLWERATHLVWLDPPFRVVMRRAIARSWRRARTRERLFNDNVETFAGAFLSWYGIPWWVLRSFWPKRRRWAQRLRGRRFSHLEVHRPRSEQEIEDLLREWGGSRSSHAAGRSRPADG